MNDVTRPVGLGWWAGPGQDLGAAIAAVREDPRVGEAVRALVGAMLELCAADPALLAVFKDAGRYSAAMWAFYLHESGELTLPALRSLCASSGLQSPGRVRALLGFLHHLRYVERTPSGGRALRYAATPTFITAWRRQLRAALSSVVVMEPEVGDLLSSGDEGVLHAFGRIHAEGYLALTAGPSSVPRVIRVFLHAYAGSQILWTLLGSSRGGEFPPAEAGPVSILALARRFGVARVQVKRVLEAAVNEGLVRHDGQGVIHFTREARQEIEFLYVVQLVQILRAAGAAARASPPTRRVGERFSADLAAPTSGPGPGAAGC